MPGQLGPTMRDLFWVLSMSVMRTMSGAVSTLAGSYVACWRIPCWGMPSVMLSTLASVYAAARAHVRDNQRDLRLNGLLDTGGSDGGTVRCQVRCGEWVGSGAHTGRRWRSR
jgi:hypothetical protein